VDPPAQPEHPSGAPPPEVLQDAAATFGLLAAPVRLHILWLLARGERDVGTLAAEVGQSVATVSHHLGKLKLAGLVRARRAGKHQIYLIDDPHVTEIVQLAVAHHHGHRDATPARRRSQGA
jgi:DNA-binding transcriptional ArsR family regulator